MDFSFSMKIQKGASIIEVETTGVQVSPQVVHNVDSPGAPASKWRRNGSLSNEGQVST